MNSKESAGQITQSKPSPRLQLHGAIYRPESYVFMPRYCTNLKAIRYESTSLNRIVTDKLHRVIVALRLQLHGAIYRPDSFVLMIRHSTNLKALRYESTNSNRIVADKSHRVIVA